MKLPLCVSLTLQVLYVSDSLSLSLSLSLSHMIVVSGCDGLVHKSLSLSYDSGRWM